MLPEPETGVTPRVWGDNRRVWDTVNRPQTLPRRNGDLCEAPCGAPLDLVRKAIFVVSKGTGTIATGICVPRKRDLSPPEAKFLVDFGI